MTDTTPHGQGDENRPQDTDHRAAAEDASRDTSGEGTSTQDVFGQPAVRRADHDHTDVIDHAHADETDVIPTGTDTATDRYTAPYPTIDGDSSGSDHQASPYGSDNAHHGQAAASGSGQGQYGQGQQYGQSQSQYGQSQHQYGQSQHQYDQSQHQYGQDQYGQSQTPYGQSQTPYGQSQTPYGQSQSPYGQGQYGQGQSEYGQSQYDRPRYGEYAQGTSQYAAPQSAPYPGSAQAPSSASAFGDVDGSNQRNGHYFGGAAAGAATGSAAGAATSTDGRNGRNKLVLPIVAGLVLAGLVGGGAGWAAGASQTGTTVIGSGSSQSGGNLTVNDYNNATVVTAVAAQATPSVVTINVSSGSAGGTGSGVFFTKDGYIVTNTHVVTLDGDSANGTITVTTSDGRIYPAKLVGTDPTVDLAVIKIDATGTKPISFADSSDLNVGDTAVAIGAPLGLSNTVTDGIVSTLNRSIQVASSAPNQGGDSNEGGNGDSPFEFPGNGGSSTSTTVSLPVIQTDASINPGNSGGALLDSKGKLIGINVAIASAGSSQSSDSQSGSIGVGFAIPSNLVERVANEIRENGSATHGLLGATVGDASEDANATQTGALIKSVSSGGAAANAGLQKGDVVTKIGSASVADATDLTAQVRFFAGGAKTTITYIRDGQTREADVTLGTYKS
ncbi:trypsin-like peptidase domain-containing protein [Curtobacterium sp. RHCJP20]|uniref:Trypsin-like peptidase domain-containing protein n=1 Tax=Curtobacterium subtropicum TaxID=3055138 RepID=A0ABT7TDW5_9MICO|nr:trypsin-like peptidase domain-containing protein [Curtobacterium subtropicum]MDM7887084.1 trypsin-like peptidase domain-containing protein [Curtobacterium subtropicum]